MGSSLFFFQKRIESIGGFQESPLPLLLNQWLIVLKNSCDPRCHMSVLGLPLERPREYPLQRAHARDNSWVGRMSQRCKVFFGELCLWSFVMGPMPGVHRTEFGRRKKSSE